MKNQKCLSLLLVVNVGLALVDVDVGDERREPEVLLLAVHPHELVEDAHVEGDVLGVGHAHDRDHGLVGLVGLLQQDVGDALPGDGVDVPEREKYSFI